MVSKIKKIIKRIIEKYNIINIEERCIFYENGFRGQVAVITGGTGDIGNAIAEQLISQGCRVVITGRKQVQFSKEEKLKFVHWDLSDLSDREAKFSECLHCFGKINIWINCAGYISHNDLQGDFFHVTEEEWQNQMDVNSKALYFLTQTVAKYFIKNGIPGYIVQILSIDGIRDTWQPYGISKRVGIQFTREIARVLSPYDIHMFGIAPGGVKTQMIENVLHGKTLRKNSVPNRRLASKEEIANLVCFLISGRADRLSGTIVTCDGGDTLL